jgi:hypothetical protein
MHLLQSPISSDKEALSGAPIREQRQHLLQAPNVIRSAMQQDFQNVPPLENHSTLSPKAI